MLKTAGYQHGNVLFIILIAIMLFAGLAAAITRSNQGSGNMDRERGSLDTSDLTGYGASMEKTVARMLGDEMSENGISFENTTWKLNNGTDVHGANANCTSDRCRVFNIAGGGMEARTFAGTVYPSPAAAEVASGHGGVFSLKVTGVGTTAHDMVLMIGGIADNVCTQINDRAGITNPSGTPPEDGWAGAVLYNGAFTGPNNATDEIGDVATGIAGRTSGCVRRSGGIGSGDNFFYQVLLPR